MRRRLTRFVVGAVLAAAWATAAGAYVDRAYACSTMANRVDRPSCCATAGRMRVTAPGGDCCKDLRWLESASATVRAPEPPPMAQWALVPVAAMLDLDAALDAARGSEQFWARAGPERGPPPLVHVDTVVLLI